MKDFEQIDYIILIALFLTLIIASQFIFTTEQNNKPLTYCLIKYNDYEQIEILKTQKTCINKAFNP